MQAVEIKQPLEKPPFEAFTIRMANGSKFAADHPENAMFSVNTGSSAVAPRPGGFAIADLHLAAHTEPEAKPSRRRKH